MNNRIILQLNHMEAYLMVRRYSPTASKDVERAMRKRKRATLKSGKGGRVAKSEAANRQLPSAFLKLARKARRSLARRLRSQEAFINDKLTS